VKKALTEILGVERRLNFRGNTLEVVFEQKVSDPVSSVRKSAIAP
jgi:hypothetical protein